MDTSTFDDHLAERLLYQRIVMLSGELDDALAHLVCAEFLLLSAEDPRADISLFINSPGGSITAGMAVFDTMRLLPCDVATLALGFAASMGQFLLCSGAAGKRFALPHARIMMHQPSAGIGGTAADIAIQAENLEYTKSLMHALIAQASGQSVETIAADSDRDRWFTAEQARDYGLVDHVVAALADLRVPAPAHRRAGL